MENIALGEGSSQSLTHLTNISPTELTQAIINETTPVSALTFAQRRKVNNWKYYQGDKENNENNVNSQGSIFMGSEGTSHMCSRLTYENLNGKNHVIIINFEPEIDIN